MSKKATGEQAGTPAVVGESVICNGEIVETKPVDLQETQITSGEKNSVQVNLQTEGLAFQVHTQMPVNNQVIDLSARVELLTAQLEQAQQCLQQSMHRIGFLEAQLEHQQTLIDHLCKHQESQ